MSEEKKNLDELLEEETEDDYEYLTLDFDGEEVACAIIDEFELNGKDYIVLLPDEEEDAVIYSYKEDEEGLELFNLEEDEFQEAVKKYIERAGADE